MSHPISLSLWPVIIFLTIALISSRVPTCLCADDPQFLNCSSTIQCGVLQDISYPFWGSNRPSYCGLGDEHNLTCEDNTTALFTIGDVEYRLLSYDNSKKNFTVARNDYWGTLCPSTYQNSSQDPSPLAYTSDTVPNNLTFFYGCNANVPALPADTQFTCPTSGSVSIGYYVTTNVEDISTFGSVNLSTLLGSSGECDTTVVVPAYVSAIQAIVSNPLNTTVEAALEQGLGMQLSDDANNTCAKCTGSGGLCGRDQSSGDFACYCSGGSTSSICSGSGSTPRKWLIISTVSAAVILLGIIATVLTIWFCKQRKSSFYEGTNNNVEVVINSHGFLTPKRYKYSELKKITNLFTEKIGQGGYGTVYKGKLSDGQLVAVKLLTKSKSEGHGEEFINEVASISRTSHVNVVNLLGFCYERNKRALIYKFMPNGSLDQFIPPEGALHTSLKIDWKVLHQIILGVARGLEYLHRGCTTRILHFDIKPQNILLDEDLIPKISDFGLAKLCLGKESIVSLLDTRGTIGYIAPEVFSRNFGRVSHKSDVYSYGMLVLAMVCGKSINNDQVSHSSDMYFPHSIYKQLKPNIDFKFQGIVTHEEEEIARKLILVSFWCIQTNPSHRPSITNVIDMLEGSLHSVDMPPEPFLSNPMSLHQSLAMAIPSISSNKDDDEEESSLVVDGILRSMK